MVTTSIAYISHNRHNCGGVLFQADVVFNILAYFCPFGPTTAIFCILMNFSAYFLQAYGGVPKLTNISYDHQCYHTKHSNILLILEQKNP